MGFKSAPAAIGTSNTDVFQMGTGLAGAIVLGIGNQTSGAIAYTVKIFKLATGVTTTIVTSQSLAGNQFKKFEIPIALEAGDKVVMTAASTGISALATVTDSSVAPVAKGYTPRGPYSSIATYNINDVVTASDGSSYISTEDDNIGNDPTSSPMSWMVNAEKGETGTPGDTAMSIVRVAATTNITIASAIEDGDTLDGVTLATGDLVLLTGQTAPAENGVYLVQASGAAARASGFATYDSYPGRYFSVMEGTVGADKLYRCTSNKGGTLGTTAIVIAEFTSGSVSGAVNKVVGQVFTTSGTYTPTPGMVYCVIEAVGGGAGGGGTGNSAAQTISTGGGGGGGECRSVVATAATIGGSKTITIGASGAGGSVGNNNGTAGGDSSVGTICVAKGGGAGGGNSGSGTATGGAGGTGGTGTLGIPGEAGHNGSSSSSPYPSGGGGQSGGYGYGARSTISATFPATGAAGQGFGGGGAGGQTFNATGTAGGGAGASGVVFITEFCSV